MDKQEIEELAWVIQNGCIFDCLKNTCEFDNDKTLKKVYDKRLEQITRSSLFYLHPITLSYAHL